MSRTPGTFEKRRIHLTCQKGLFQTGDIKYNPNGNLLIMTTEILRNLLFNKKIQDVENRVAIEIDIQKDFSLVIFDEIHYINDIDRGKVWEESIILLPEHIQLMMKSRC